MDNFRLVTWYLNLPVVTRTYVTACCLTAAAITFHVVEPIKLYLNFDRIVARHEYWRLVTTFIFFGSLNGNFFFHMHYLCNYFSRLENQCYRTRPVSFLVMLFSGAVLMIFAAYFLNILFLSSTMILYVLYVWCRRNPHEQLSIFGVLTVSAPYLPYLFILISLTMKQPVQDELLGIVVGHTFWFVTDVAPKIWYADRKTRSRILHYL